MFNPASNAFEKFLIDDEVNEDDTLVNSVFEGRLEHLQNITEAGDDYKFMGEEFSQMLNNITSLHYAVFFDLMENSSVDILIVMDKPSSTSYEPQT